MIPSDCCLVLLPELFGKDFSRQNGPGKSLPMSSGNDPKEIVNEDLGYVFQIFLPLMMGNDPIPCSFVYVIVPHIPICFLYYISVEYYFYIVKPKSFVHNKTPPKILTQQILNQGKKNSCFDTNFRFFPCAFSNQSWACLQMLSPVRKCKSIESIHAFYLVI